MLKLKSLNNQKDIERIINERKILIGVDNKCVVKMHSCFKNDRKAFFVLDYCPGGELFNILLKKKKLTEN